MAILKLILAPPDSQESLMTLVTLIMEELSSRPSSFDNKLSSNPSPHSAQTRSKAVTE